MNRFVVGTLTIGFLSLTLMMGHHHHIHADVGSGDVGPTPVLPSQLPPWCATCVIPDNSPPITVVYGMMES